MLRFAISKNKYRFLLAIYMVSRFFPTRWIVWHHFPRPLNAAKSPTLIHVLSSVVGELRSAIITLRSILKVPETINERSEDWSRQKYRSVCQLLFCSEINLGQGCSRELSFATPSFTKWATIRPLVRAHSLEMFHISNHVISRFITSSN